MNANTNKTPMNRRSSISAQIHRFHDSVACYLGTGETVYLTPKEALALAKAVRACALDCKKTKFSTSSIGTAEFKFGAATYE